MKYYSMKSMVINKIKEMINCDSVELMEKDGMVDSVLVHMPNGMFQINLHGSSLLSLLNEHFDWTFIQDNLCDTRNLFLCLKNWEYVKSHLFPRFAGKARRCDENYMSNSYSVNVLDLDITFHVILDEKYSATVSNSMVREWGVTSEILLKVALDNALKESNILSLDGLLMDMGFELDEEDRRDIEECCSSMYILTNKKRSIGAIHMLDKELLKKFCEKLNEDEVYIIPSSIHEVLLLPCGNFSEIDSAMVNDMIVDVNQKLDDFEILSDHCYRYCATSDKLWCLVNNSEFVW